MTTIATKPVTTKSSVLDPATQAFLDAISASDGPPIYKLSFKEARKILEEVQSGPVEKLPADTEDRFFPVGPRGQISVRIYRPKGVREALPAVMHFHGGGWVLGSENTHDRLLRDLTNGTQAAHVFVNYTPSPEAQFPVPVEEAYAATQFVAEHGKELNLQADRLAIAGDSVGGNMTAAVTLLAKQRGGPKIRYQVLFYPVTNADFETDSYRQFANGPWLTQAAMKWFWDAYAPGTEDRQKPTASPLKASLDELRGLPPALVITDENDVLRDEGEAYARKLSQAGVTVTAVRVLGTIHDFVLLNGLAKTPPVRSAIELATTHLRIALAK